MDTSDFRLATAKTPTSFSDFYCQSTYVPETDTSDALCNQVAVSTQDEEQEEQSTVAFSPKQHSVESLYEAAAQFSEKE